MEIYKLDQEAVFQELSTSKQGLSKEEAAKRFEQYGPNVIQEVKKRPLIFKFLENFYHLFAILLWVGGFLAFPADQAPLGFAIFAVIFVNAIFSFWQEFKAEKATEALKKLLPAYAKVIRDGEHQKILASELVPGDLVILEEGDAISADGRVIENFELRTNDSSLTGESHPRRKLSDPFLEENISSTESPNLIFAGTSVVSGAGKAIIFATGMKSEFGRIAYLTQSVKDELSPLQKEMKWVTKVVAALAIGLGIVFYFLGTAKGLGAAVSFTFAIGIIVANVPEGLLPTVTLSLAMGVQRMAKRHALIKKLSSVETLGSTTVICTDKTGTLTQNEMTVREMWANGHTIDVTGTGYEPMGTFLLNDKIIEPVKVMQDMGMLLKTSAICNTAKLVAPNEENTKWSILGDPTEAALIVAAKKAGFDLDALYSEGFLAHQNPFESGRKRMSVVYKYPSKTVAYVKGAPKEMLDLCTSINIRGKIQRLTDKLRDEILAVNDDFARRALRVLAMGYREVSDNQEDLRAEKVEKEMVFVGLMAMMDPPREEVEVAVHKCKTAGIRVIMITGDYGLTAESIARKIGIINVDNAEIITGADLDNLSDEQLAGIIKEQEVIFARVTPEHKMRVVSTLKDTGEIVAVTGDGVNDAPALKRADIGVAMGIAGTDVAKEAADMILTDDNFASIVNAIEEGRAVFDNIKRFVTYIFASNIPEIVPFIFMVLFEIPLPLTVMQILAIDLGTDMLPALALGTERAEPGVMNKPPRGRNERLLNAKVLARAYFFLGPLEAAVCMFGFFYIFYQNNFTYNKIVDLGGKGINVYKDNLVYIKATTMTHIGVITTQIGNAFAVRTNRESVFKIGFFTNKLLLLGIVGEVLGILLLVNVQPLQGWFDHYFVSVSDWLVMFAWAPLLLIADETRKFFVRRFYPLDDEKSKAAA